MDKKPIIIRTDDYRQLYDVACGDWKGILATWFANDILLTGSAEVSQERLAEMYYASNMEQKAALHKVFGKFHQYEVGDRVFVLEDRAQSSESKQLKGKVVTLAMVTPDFVSTCDNKNRKVGYGGMYLDEVRPATELEEAQVDYPKGTWVVGWHTSTYKGFKWKPWQVGSVVQKVNVEGTKIGVTPLTADGLTGIDNIRLATNDEILNAEFVSLKPNRLKYNDLEKFMHDKFRDDYCDIRDEIKLERLVFEQKNGVPVDTLSERERRIVLSTIQWLGTNVGKGFLHSCGFEFDKERIEL